MKFKSTGTFDAPLSYPNIMAPDVRPLDVQGAQQALPARLYTPGMLAPHTGLVVFFHHGGFIKGNIEEADEFVQKLATRTGYRVLSSSYTLADRSPFPAAVEDAYSVLKWASQHRSALGWDGKRLIAAGVEAGGNLAAVSALMTRDRSGPALAAQILIMPMLDPGLTTCSMRALPGEASQAEMADACAAGYRGYLPRAADRMHPYASPLKSSRLKGLAPALILSAEEDPLRDEAEQYGEKLMAAGNQAIVRRLGSGTPDQRCRCVDKNSALNEIAAFLAGLDSNPDR